MVDSLARQVKSATRPDTIGNKYLNEDTLQRSAREKGRIVSPIGEQPEVRDVYVAERIEISC